MSTEHERWVRDGATVDANFANGGGIHATGRVISYTDRPTVTIETTDGRRISWIANLCKDAGDAS